jgi:hypothetical protein
MLVDDIITLYYLLERLGGEMGQGSKLVDCSHLKSKSGINFQFFNSRLNLLHWPLRQPCVVRGCFFFFVCVIFM